MNRRSKTLLLSGVIVVFTTIIILVLCIKDWSGITPLASIFIVFAELILFLGMTFVEKIATATEQLVIRSSYSVLLLFYTAISVIISLVFINKNKYAFITFIVLQLLLFSIIIIQLIVMYFTSKGIRIFKEKTLTATTQLDSLIGRLNTLSASESAKANTKALKKLAEDLRFTDTSTLVASDTQIDRVISELELELNKETEAQRSEFIEHNITLLNSLIAKRKVEVSSIRKGNI